MDSDTSENHAFLKSVERLVKLKETNPKLRLSGATPLKESISVSEEEKVGMRGPKRKFLELSKYEQRFGPAPAGKIKTITFKGQKIKGVDIIREEDAPCHDSERCEYSSQLSLSLGQVVLVFSLVTVSLCSVYVTMSNVYDVYFPVHHVVSCLTGMGLFGIEFGLGFLVLSSEKLF